MNKEFQNILGSVIFGSYSLGLIGFYDEEENDYPGFFPIKRG